MTKAAEHVEARPVAYTHKGTPTQPHLLASTWKPGQSGNPKGGPRGPRRNVNDHLWEYFEKEIEREIPDGDRNPRVVKVQRMELFAQMVGANCFKVDIDPGLRRDCIKYVMERLAPAKTTERDWEPFVEQGQYTTEVGRSFLGELERTAGLMPVTPSIVLAVLQRGNGNGRGLAGPAKTVEAYDEGEGI